MKISRRNFFAQSSGFLFSLAPILGAKTSLLPAGNIGLSKAMFPDEKNILVVIHLAGGNDWFNTIIPYNDPAYYRQRPSLAISSKDVLKLDNEFAFHPSLAEIKGMYDRKEVAILLNCGVSEHDLSHHKAIRLMQYSNIDQKSNKTWQAHYADGNCSEVGQQDFPIINVEPLFYRDEIASGQIKSKEKLVHSFLNESNNFEFNMDVHYEMGNRSSDLPSYVEHGFDLALKQITQLIMNKTNATVYHISLGGFDTHMDQLAQHAYLLRMLSEGASFFHSDLKKCGFGDKVLTLICSEFGRSYRENENQGTDHGYLNHILAIGRPVKGGIYGNRCGQIANSPQNKNNCTNIQAMALSWLSSARNIEAQKYIINPII